MSLSNDEIPNNFLAEREYQSGVLIEFTERHAGPLWYNLVTFTFKFHPDGRVIILADRMLSKKMGPEEAVNNTMEGNYSITYYSPTFSCAQMEINDKKFHFETVPNNDHLLFLENPSFWRGQSMVIKKI